MGRKTSLVIASVLMASLAAPPVLAQKITYPQAVATYKNGNYAQALSQFKQVDAAFPNNAMVHYYIALCHQGLGHLNLARSEYQQVVNMGDARLAGLARQGLNQLSGAKTQVYSGGSPSQISATQQPAMPAKKIARKVLYFYADW
ncbi:MAG: tetratricopeptide repeat protein [Cyanobacteria bacterium HKST-UBA02]|nr:tetratricopeptide repeat protein [Cyanobacteria bacterium HKST-UBA02]